MVNIILTVIYLVLKLEETLVILRGVCVLALICKKVAVFCVLAMGVRYEYGKTLGLMLIALIGFSLLHLQI